MLTISSKVKNLDCKVIKEIERVCLTAMKELNQPIKQVGLNVYFVSEQNIRQLNKETRGVDKVTDVLSYPMLDLKAGEVIDFDKNKMYVDPYNNTLLVGEIVICNTKAIKQAQKYGHSYMREVCFLFLHGLLHCLGYDHIDENDRVVMEEKQTQILNKCKITRD